MGGLQRLSGRDCFFLENTYSVSVHYRMRDHISAENVRFARDFETDRSKEG